MKRSHLITSKESFTKFLFYTPLNGKMKVGVFLRDVSLWLTPVKMAELFDVEKGVIAKHLQDVYSAGEFNQDATSIKIWQHQIESKKSQHQRIVYYNLDVILAVGYRVNSAQATHFHIWAMQVLSKYGIPGFDEHLKHQPTAFGHEYFEEQLVRIRDIRKSERQFYQKITDIYSQCSADYDPNSEIAKKFFSVVQNKLYFAIAGKTAAEIIYERADSNKLHMGLTAWKNAPTGRIRKDDVNVAKNYLDDKELDALNRIVSMYLDYAEMQVQKGVVMYMKDWAKKLDAFLKFNEKEVWHDTSKVTPEVAAAVAANEYDKFKGQSLIKPH